MTDHKPTSEMVSAGAKSVVESMDGFMRGQINMAKLAERVWCAMEDEREPRIFRGRFAPNELALIADYVDQANVHPNTPVSDLVYETCEMVKRMAEDLGRMEKDLGEKYKSFVAEAERADRAEAKVAELRRVIQEMVELGSDHMDTANEILVHYMDGSSEPVHGERGPHSTQGGSASRVEWLERGIREIANDYAGTEYDDVSIMLKELLAGREPTAESEYMGH